MLLVSPGGRPGEHFSPVSALSEYLAHDLSLGPSLPELGQTGVLRVVGEDEQPVHRSRLWVMLLGSEQEVKPVRTALVGGQYGSASPTLHRLHPPRPATLSGRQTTVFCRGREASTQTLE
jgi:hypothetical protein